jgi:hypothetical protein
MTGTDNARSIPVTKYFPACRPALPANYSDGGLLSLFDHYIHLGLDHVGTDGTSPYTVPPVGLEPTLGGF